MPPHEVPVPIEQIQRDLSWWEYGWPVAVVIQVICLVHVFRTGRPYWWFWVIMGFPFGGVAIYVICEMRPTWRRLDWRSLMWLWTSPAQRIRLRETQFEEAPSVNSRLVLAAELHAHQQYDRECEVLAAGLVGPFRNDTTLLLRLAEAHLECGRTSEAEACITQCTEQRRRDEELAIRLLEARILSFKGQFAEAETIFLELTNRRRSEAPRYFHAESLFRADRTDESRELLNDILKQYRRGTTVWRKLEREWFLAARRLLKSIASKRR